MFGYIYCQKFNYLIDAFYISTSRVSLVLVFKTNKSTNLRVFIVMLLLASTTNLFTLSDPFYFLVILTLKLS